MAPVAPSPVTWTLRFKYQQSTVVMHVDPLQSLDSIKNELLHALRETHPDGTLGGLPIPSKASDLLLARPNDVHNLDKGWTSLIDSEGNVITGNEPVFKKRKTDEGALNVRELCPKAAGLRDGFVLAFKFASGQGGQENIEDEEWDVTMPSYDYPTDVE